MDLKGLRPPYFFLPYLNLLHVLDDLMKLATKQHIVLVLPKRNIKFSCQKKLKDVRCTAVNAAISCTPSAGLQVLVGELSLRGYIAFRCSSAVWDLIA